MTETRVPRGAEWSDVLEVLHTLANTVTVRSHYAESHPAIAHADELAAQGFARVLERIPDLVVALIEGEFVICDRPLPDMRARLHVLADAMVKHEIECIVFQKGMTAKECTILGSALAMPQDMPGRVREQAQAALSHVLLRFAGMHGDGLGDRATAKTPFFVPAAVEVLVSSARAIAAEGTLDKLAITSLANQIVVACSQRTFALQQRSFTRGIEDEAAHATNVAMMTALMAIDAGYPQRTCIDVTAAALLHDIGHLFLPEEIRGLPEPLVEERMRPVFRNHTFAGATMLLGAGAPPLWVAAAFEHHRGVDGKGYPELASKDPPHELVRMIALANFIDRKRTLIEGRASDPEEALRAAIDLEPRYFGRPLVQRLVRTLGIHPPGTTVELSDGRSAVVTRTNGADPFRPQVRFLRGEDAGRYAELRDVNGAEARYALSIARPIAPPLLVLDDVAMPEVAEPEVAADGEGELSVRATIAPPAAPGAGGPSVLETARAELADMDAMLDSLLAIPTHALSALPAPPSQAPQRFTAPVTMPGPPAGASAPPTASAPPLASAPPRTTSVADTLAQAAETAARPPVVTPAAREDPAPRTTMRIDMRAEPVEAMGLTAARAAPASPPSRPTRRLEERGVRPDPRSEPVQPIGRRPDPRSEPVQPSEPTGKRIDPRAEPSDPRPPSRAAARSDEPPTAASRPPRASAAPAAELPMHRVAKVVAPDLARVGLDHRGGFLLTFIDGHTTLEDIVDASGLPRADAVAILADLLARGAIAVD